MKWSSVLLVALLGLVVAVGVINCGESNHGPGSDGMANTGSRMEITHLMASSGTGAANTFIQDISVDSTTTTQFDSGFDVTVECLGATQGANPTTGITLETYDVVCNSSAPGSVPIGPLTKMTLNDYITPSGKLEIKGLAFFTAEAKRQWLSDGGNINLEPPYQCKVTLHGVNDFGYEMTAVGSFNILVGWFP